MTTPKLKPSLLTNQMKQVREEIIGYVNRLWKEQKDYAQISAGAFPGEAVLCLDSDFYNTGIRIEFNSIAQTLTIHYKKKQGPTDFLYELIFQVVPFDSNVDEHLQWRMAELAHESIEQFVQQQKKKKNS